MQASQSQPLPDAPPRGNVAFACQACAAPSPSPPSAAATWRFAPTAASTWTCPLAPICEIPRRRLHRPRISRRSAPLRPGRLHCRADPDKLSGRGFPATRQLWFEVIAVLFLAVIPPLSSAVVLAGGWEHASHSFYYRRLGVSIFNFQVVLPLLLILKLTREPWARFGIVRFSCYWTLPWVS